MFVQLYVCKWCCNRRKGHQELQDEATKPINDIVKRYKKKKTRKKQEIVIKVEYRERAESHMGGRMVE